MRDVRQLGFGQVSHEAEDHDPDVQRCLSVLVVLQPQQRLLEGTLHIVMGGVALEVGLGKLDEFVVRQVLVFLWIRHSTHSWRKKMIKNLDATAIVLCAELQYYMAL